MTRALVALALVVCASVRAAPADDVELARGLTRVVTIELAKSPALEVLSSADLRQVIELEGTRQGLGCEQESCLGDVAGALGARFVVFGELVRLESSLMFTATLYDSEQGSSRARVVRRGATGEALLEALPGAVGELVGATVFGLQPGTKLRVLVLDIKPPAPPAPIVAAVEPKRDDDTLAYVILGAGSVLAVSGGVYDVLSPTSNDEAFGAEDLISVGLIGAGVAAGITGAVMIFSGDD